MIISLWRYSHLALAISSCIFITIASLTGIVLSFEPVTNNLSSNYVSGVSELSLAETVTQLKSKYDEVFSLEVDVNGFVAVSVMDAEGNMGDFYIDPFTGEKIGDLIDKSSIYEFATSLHRSLFLKGLGRFFVGLSSLLLFFIAFTGIILIIKRQQGIRHFFSKIIKENFYQYYHVYLGRLALIPIVIITLTGTYLSLQRFAIIPEVTKTSHNITFETLSETPAINHQEFPIFKNIQLSEVRSLEFPFSPDVEDYYTLKLKEKELVINQLTGEVLSEVEYPLVTLLSDLSLVLHTGRGNVWWALVLGVSTCSILFFIYSGFNLTLKRKQSSIKNTLNKDDCDYIILVGSETGYTIPFAVELQQQLLKAGKKVYLTELNRYSRFKQMKQLVVMTSTYGLGEAPANANKFIDLFNKENPKQAYGYSIVGFGSRAYPDYCKFAYIVDELLLKDSKSTRLFETFTINNRSWEAYIQWLKMWGTRQSLKLDIPTKNPLIAANKKKEEFKVLLKTEAHHSSDDTFLIKLASSKKIRYNSGDLLAVYPSADAAERLYSMSVTATNQILLSVKRHDKGLCSNLLNSLKDGDILEGNIIKNKHFYFPKKAKSVVLISTGTGIAPFLGMLEHNDKKIETHLYWGARNQASYKLYSNYIESSLNKKHLNRFVPAYSRVGDTKIYVQDLILKDRYIIAQTLKERGVIMLCGSIAMQKGVSENLDKICKTINKKPLSYYQNKNQIRMDCY
ncbi:PepSY domain-containing protein [Chondrinema litorale]|uniref:PepSY domain-containing protein n=1 Tax=Chondrinema litorale TaxID=2994555 RepID=UPI0025427E16|nr:PepSY domain-containing protein [Chondrinema litorale]UZR99642.1 PepSY domain-containing protein [Chondrinema litorale]